MAFQPVATTSDALHTITPIKQDVVITSTEVAPLSSSASSEVHSDDDLALSVDAGEEPAVTEDELSNMHDAGAGLTALKVLQVVETYGSRYGQGDATWRGLSAYLPLVKKQIAGGKPIQLLFSGFPFKLPLASGQVLGQTPDLGEQLALEHLNGICSNIGTIYDKGAKIDICSNGLLYNGMYTP